ncbi:MAG: NAD-dependent epimerase/dehydratase family protein [Actinomycetota bacterium]|nr:NAD-dependent epimerase/dehydratase family protein [Actinomycetota bacterium]
MTRILVTGAAGFIGSHLCESLLEQGFNVRGLDAFTSFYQPARKHANIQSLLDGQAFELHDVDLLAPGLADLLDDVDAIAHLAGEPGVSTSWGPGFERYLERNVLATHRLLEAASTRGIQCFVYASSSSVYGVQAAADGRADALGQRGEPRPASPYGVSKLAAETLVGAHAHSHGLQTVSLRYFSVYGPRQRPDMAAHRFIEALLDRRPLTLFGDGGQVRDFTYVGDIVEATVKALLADLPPGAVLDIASGRPVEVRALITLVGELVGVDTTPLQQQAERPGDVPRTQGRIAAAAQHLGWAPTTDLRTGLTRQIAWHRGLRDERSARGTGEIREPELGGTHDTTLIPATGG